MFRVAKAFILEMTVSFPGCVEGVDSVRTTILEDLIAEFEWYFPLFFPHDMMDKVFKFER